MARRLSRLLARRKGPVYDAERWATANGKKEVDCLRCERPFTSEGKHNRLCERCRGIATDMVSESLYPSADVSTPAES